MTATGRSCASLCKIGGGMTSQPRTLRDTIIPVIPARNGAAQCVLLTARLKRW
jgi:hypothetical protein